MRLGRHVEDTIHEDLGTALGQEAEDIRDELIAAAVWMDADSKPLHLIHELGRRKGVKLIQMDPRRNLEGLRKRVDRGEWGGRDGGLCLPG